MKNNLKELLKLCFISIFSLFVISCSSAEFQNFMNEISTYEITPEYSSNPEEFLKKFYNICISRMKKETQDYLYVDEETKKTDEYIKNKKTGVLILKYVTGEKRVKKEFVNGNLKKATMYYQNGKIAMNIIILVNKNMFKMTFYYPNGQLAFEWTFNETNKGITGEIKGYYENGKPAIIFQKNKKGKMYRKDGRVRFEIIDGFDNYRTIS